MKKKLLILDFDGTIGDTNRIITNTMQATLTELGLEMHSREECSKTIGLPLKDCFLSLMPMDDDMADRCASVYRCIFSASHANCDVPVFPKVIETLRKVHNQGLQISLASSRSSKSLREFVDEMQLNDYISFVLGAEDVVNAKPNAEPVIKTLAHYNTLPSEALVVGDMNYDILMGKNAGCMTCGVTYGNGTKEELELAGADYIIDDFSKLVTLLGSK
nr:HAD-IA family hydrolase [Prevotella sp.]